MNERKVSGIILMMLLFGLATLAFDVRLARASGTIYIRADGSIDPADAPIQRNGDLYTLTSSITSELDGIVIERDNMILDGAGYTVQGTGGGIGVSLLNRFNVTIQRMAIRNFENGIRLVSSQNNNVSGNIVTMNHDDGIWLQSSSYNNIAGNDASMNGDGQGGRDYDGIELESCHHNNVVNNNVIANYDDGIELYYSTFNNVVENNIAGNGCGLWDSYENSNNKIYHNNFAGNTYNAMIGSGVYDTWDDGYPSGGNYWSDYTDFDQYSGPNQDQSGSDGIWDNPYVIDANNKDHYPLVNAPRNSDGAVDLFSQKGGKGSNQSGGVFHPQEQVTLCALVTYNEEPLADKPVSFEVTPPNPIGGFPLTRVSFTNASGIAITNFVLPQDPEEIVLGTWFAVASVDITGVRVVDTLTFEERARTPKPVGGYSFPTEGYITPEPLTPYIAVLAILMTAFTAVRRKTRRKTK